MNAGGAYALVLNTAPVKTSLMIGSLRAALKEAIPCLLVLSSASDVSSTKALVLWGEDLIHPTQNELLRIFIHEQDFKSNLFRYGINRFIQDLELLKPQNKSYIWFDHAEQLFALQDMHFATKQLKILKDWLQARDITATFVFAKLNSTETHDIHLLSEDLAGLCRITSGAKGLEARFLHWQSPDGAISHKNYGLEETASGFYRATLTAQALNESETGTVEVDTQTTQDVTPLFISLDPSVKAALDSGAIKWQFLDSPLSLFHAVRGSVTPSIVLRFGQDTLIRQLAETVHTLRTVVGRGAKIIIHEDAFSLRFSYESLLMRLGANFIMHRDVPPWRLLRVVDSLEGTRFDRAVDVDFGALVGGAFPSEQSGLLSVDSLVLEIESIFLKTKLNNLPKAFLTGLVVPSRNAEDILSQVHMDREGDLFAFEGQTIYIFLSACPPSHVTETIERKLKDSLDTIFTSSNIWTDQAEIQEQLLSLKGRMTIKPTERQTAIAEPIILPEQFDDKQPLIIVDVQALENLTLPALHKSEHAVNPIAPEIVAVHQDDGLAADLTERYDELIASEILTTSITTPPEFVSESDAESVPEFSSIFDSEYEFEHEHEVGVDILPEVSLSIEQQEIVVVPEGQPPTQSGDIVMRSPFSSDRVSASVLPTGSILNELESNASERVVADIFIKAAPQTAEPISDTVEPELQIAPLEQAVDAPLAVEPSSEPIPAKFKPLVFLKSRSANDTPTE